MNLAQFNEFVLEATTTHLVLETAGNHLESLTLEHGSLTALHSEPLPELPQRFELVGSLPWLQSQAFTAAQHPVRVCDLLRAIEAYERRTRSAALENLNPNHIYFEGVYPVRDVPGRFEIAWGS